MFISSGGPALSFAGGRSAFRRTLLSCGAPGCQRGGLAISVAIALPVLLGFASLGIEGSTLLMAQRHQKVIANAAALGASSALAAGGTGKAQKEAAAVFLKAGLAGGGGTALAVNIPPQTGPNTGDRTAVEVIVGTEQTMMLSALVYSDAVQIRARSVAKFAPQADFCVLALDASDAAALTIAAGAVLQNKTCGAATRTTGTPGLNLGNGAAFDGPVAVLGGLAALEQAGIDLKTAVIYNSGSLADPYAALQLPPLPPCTSQSTVPATGSTVLHLHPGRFCSPLTVSSNMAVTLAAGVYIFDDVLTLGNGVTVNGTAGVTIEFNKNARFNLGAKTVWTVAAPKDGPTAGIALMETPGANSSLTQTLGGGAVLNISGAIYFPNQALTLDATGPQNGGCLQIVARKVTIGRSIDAGNNCSVVAVKPIRTYSAHLVE